MNTLKALAQLEDADFPMKQAKAIVGVVEDNEKLLVRNLAKKEDIERLEAKIAQLEAKMVTKDEMRAEIHRAEIRLIRWIVGAVVANGVIATILGIAIRTIG